MTAYRDRLEAGEFAAPEPGPDDDALDGMTKAELLDYARTKLGVAVDSAASKADVRAVIDQARKR